MNDYNNIIVYNFSESDHLVTKSYKYFNSEPTYL